MNSKTEVIINLTQHAATPEQVAAGVVELHPEDRLELQRLLTFEKLPDLEEIWRSANSIAALAVQYRTPARAALIGGAPYLMGPLEKALRRVGLIPLYAFSVRESVDVVQPDGSVRKTSVFKHAGFVEGALHI